jgi:aspartate aminotransferase-like enzyme
MTPKLFIPGPVAVSPRTLAALQRPMIGHRGSEFIALYRGLTPGLQALFGTAHPVYLATSSAWGVMEGALRNLVRRKVLCAMNGAFSDKWLDVARRCGLEAAPLRAEWGQPIEPDALRAALAAGGFDAVTLIHNETSCGCMSDLPALAAVLREFPEVVSIVDTVSSFSGVPIDQDRLGLDLVLAGSQKALALPPGLTVFSASPRALARAAEAPARGYYFDLLEFQRNHEGGMTPSTPAIPLIYALESKLADIAAEGLPARFARHARLNATVRAWGEARGLPLFPRAGSGSLTLNCLANARGLDVPALLAALRRRGFLIDGGYGPLKGRTVRISNMGDETDATIAELLGALDESLREIGA